MYKNNKTRKGSGSIPFYYNTSGFFKNAPRLIWIILLGVFAITGIYWLNPGVRIFSSHGLRQPMLQPGIEWHLMSVEKKLKKSENLSNL